MHEIDLIPGDDADDDGQAAHIEQNEGEQGAAKGAGNGGFRVGGLAGGGADDFQAEIAEDGHGDAEKDAGTPMRRKAAVGGVVCSANTGKTKAEEKGGAEDEKNGNGHHLNHGEPIFDGAEAFDA